jgi:hypothetical protein
VIPCACYPWGSLKDKVYQNNSLTEDELKENIEHTVSSVSLKELQKVIRNIFIR